MTEFGIAAIIAGATGVGKTEVAVDLARSVNGEVVSADSRQIYRDLSAGTAKPEGRWEQRPEGKRFVAAGVVHHLVDFLSPTAFYTAGQFARDALSAMEDIRRRNGLPLVAGGTGMYLRALTRGIAPLPGRDDAFRARWEKTARAEGRAAVHGSLRAIDPASALRIPANNLQRVIRALEVHHLTGRPLSAWQDSHTEAPPWRFRWFALRWPSDYGAHIALRCRGMLPGLIRETEILLARGVAPDAPAFQSIGYREAIRFLEGKMDRATLEESFARSTRQYAKRQLTWLKAEPSVQWLESGPGVRPRDLAAQILKELRENR